MADTGFLPFWLGCPVLGTPQVPGCLPVAPASHVLGARLCPRTVEAVLTQGGGERQGPRLSCSPMIRWHLQPSYRMLQGERKDDKEQRTKA